MEKKSMLGTLIIAFIGIVIGIVLLQTLADKNSMNSVTWTTLETQNFTNDRTAFTTHTQFPLTAHTDGSQIISLSVMLGNGTALVENTDYIMINRYSSNPYIYYIAGVNMLQSDAGLPENINVSNVTYTYHDGEYVNNGTARTFLDLIPLFFVLAIVLGIGWYAVRRTGIFGGGED